MASITVTKGSRKSPHTPSSPLLKANILWPLKKKQKYTFVADVSTQEGTTSGVWIPFLSPVAVAWRGSRDLSCKLKAYSTRAATG